MLLLNKIKREKDFTKGKDVVGLKLELDSDLYLVFLKNSL